MKIFLIVIAGLIVLSVSTLAQKSATKKDTVRYNTSEVTVTATRSPATNINVPLAVTVVPKSQFENGRGYGLDEALSLVPGALVQSRAGNQDVRVMIRGFGARGAGERSNAGTTRGLRFLVDGIPLTEPDGRTSLDLVDLSSAQSIEVIRSNTSALWGNASGGVISISTVPTLGVNSVSVENHLGSFGFSKQSTRISTSFGQTTMYLNMNNTNFDGWREHSGSTLFQASAGLSSQLAAHTKLGLQVMAASNFFRIPGPLTPDQFNTRPQQAQADTNNYNPSYVQRDERRFNRLGRIGVTLQHELGDDHSFSTAFYVEPKYLQRSERNTFRDFNRYHVGGNFIYRFQIELSPTLKNTLQVGLDDQYQDGAILFYNLDPTNNGRGRTLRDNKREGANNLGIFVQDEFTIDNKLVLYLGARTDFISYYSQNFINPITDEDRTFSQVSPKLGLSYLLLQNMSVYANFSRGVEVPAGNETDPPSALGEDTLRAINSLLEPIQSQTIEVGVKHIVQFDSEVLQALSYDVALYSVNTENDLVPYRGGRFYISAASTLRRGLELGANLQFHSGISLMISSSYSMNVLKEYSFDSIYVNKSLAGKLLVLSDNKMPGVPKMFSTVRLRYVPTFLAQLFAEFEARMVSDYFANDINSITADSYSVMDFNIGIRQTLVGNLALRAMVRVNNITDAQYISSVWINPDLSPVSKAPVFIEPGLPRNFIATLGLHYTW